MGARISAGRCECLDHLGHGEGLARAGDAEQHLIALMGAHALDEFGDGLGLVARGFVIGNDAKEAAAFGLVRPLRAMGREDRKLFHLGT